VRIRFDESVSDAGRRIATKRFNTSLIWVRVGSLY
jgi:hypothetical protein